MLPRSSTFRKSGEAGKTPLLQQDLRPDNLYKWRSRLSWWQRRLFEGAVESLLYVNGYELSTSAKPLPLPVRLACRLHNAWHAWRNSLS